MKRELSLLLCLMGLLLMCITGCKKPDPIPEEPTEEPTYDEVYDQTLLNIQEQAAESLDELMEHHSTEEALEMCAQQLLSEPEIDSVTVEGWSINIVYSDGTDGMILYTPNFEPARDLKLSPTRADKQMASNHNRILIWDAFDESIFYEGTPFVEHEYTINGFEVEVISGSDCDIESLKNRIYGYDIVQFQTHGNNGKWLVTKQEATPEYNQIYLQDRLSRKISRATIKITDYSQGGIQYKKTFYAVSHKFIADLERDFNGTVIFNCSCESLKKEKLWKAFQSRGCSAYLGSITDNLKYHFMNMVWLMTPDLALGKTLGEAFDNYVREVPTFHYSDPDGNTLDSKLDLKGDRSVTFIAPPDLPLYIENYTEIASNRAVVGIQLVNNQMEGLTECGVCFGTDRYPRIDEDPRYRLESNLAPGYYSIEMTDLTSETEYYIRVYAVLNGKAYYGEEQSFTTLTGSGPAPGVPEYVDLGLPSGTLWATRNVGANAPEESGDYFAWGETETKNQYNFENYLYSGSNYLQQLTKYCSDSEYGYNGFVDNLTVLLPEDDAATANWGRDWCMPTKEQWLELLNNTSYTWTIQNGVHGGLFVADNGNSLFLPGSGYRIGVWQYQFDENGYYWSNSLDNDDTTAGGAYAWILDFAPDDYIQGGGSFRDVGFSVRPVRTTSQVTSYVVNATPSPMEGGSIQISGGSNSGTTCTLTATANSGYTFANWTENGTVVSTSATYSFTLTCNRTLVANFVNALDGHAYVDLGLPSGILWATCNVGANAPEEYGDYFAWGETEPKDYYDWSTYKYSNGSDNTLTKYCTNSSYGYNGFIDNLTTLLSEDDAATANWGSGWRTPSQEDWQELLDNTNYIWTTQNGIKGQLFTASNGNSLFLPAAGCRRFGYHWYAGEYGEYWSNTLIIENPRNAIDLFFSYAGFCYVRLFGTDRDGWGQPVRPVHSVR